MLDVVILDAGDPLRPAQFDALLTVVSPAQRARIARFRAFRDAQNCLIGDAVARIELARLTGRDARRLTFATGAHGKPHLCGQAGVHFNVSHTGHYVACAVADTPVGIDIELVAPVEPGLARRFFAPDEAAYVGCDRGRFFQIWTKKEARIKRAGGGLSIPLASFSVLDPLDNAGIVYHRVCPDAAAFCCHVCTDQVAAPRVRLADKRMLSGLYPVDTLSSTGE